MSENKAPLGHDTAAQASEALVSVRAGLESINHQLRRLQTLLDETEAATSRLQQAVAEAIRRD